jgi:hypothetical protein
MRPNENPVGSAAIWWSLRHYDAVVLIDCGRFPPKSFVIANEVKQSKAAQTALDCFAAFAMTR